MRSIATAGRPRPAAGGISRAHHSGLPGTGEGADSTITTLPWDEPAP